MKLVDLPSEWHVCTISDVAHVNPSKIAAESELVTGFVPMSHAPTDFNGQLQFEKKAWGEIQKSYTNFQNGDVIFAKVTPCFENGKAAIIEDLPNGIGAGSSEFYVLRPKNGGILNRILYALLKTHSFSQNGAESMTGAVGLRRVPKAFVENFQFPLPPVAEQKVIADKLDTLQAQVETTKARLERIPEILKRFRQSVLSAAVSGQLTEEWRDRNNISIEDWISTNLGALATIATGKTPSRTNSEYWNGGSIPWLTSATTGCELTFEAEQFVTEQAVKECSLKVFPVGTLLLAMYGEGKTRGQVTETRLEATCNQACAAILVDENKTSKEFLKLRLQENYEETRKVAAGGAQPNLNLNKVREIPVQLPKGPEQTEIVRRVEQLFTFADSLEQKANAALARVNNLTQSILAKAFRGELTADWRAANPELISGDNSAEALLAKINAERAQLSPTKKGRAKPLMPVR